MVEEEEVEMLKRPTVNHVGGHMDKAEDPREALQIWAQAHAQEYNVLKQRSHQAIEMLKTLYNTLGEFDKTTVAASKGINTAKSGPARGMSPELQAQLAAAQAQFQAAKRPAAVTPPAAGGGA